MSAIEEKLEAVKKRIAAAKARSPYGQDVTLVAVTKFHPLEDMEEVLRFGVKEVGENRVQELEDKRRRLKTPVIWNLQGHLQKNKVKKAVAAADLIQSVDSLEIMEEINKRAGQAGKVQDVLLEFNISGEISKYGLPPESLDEAAKRAGRLPHIRVRGLMCMAPMEEDAERTRPIFRRAHEMWETLKTYFPEGQVSVLSMGMTQDFETAIEEGATMVRVGTAIFGERDYAKEKGETK
ncbi:YggS family pyridoxal phosphate-dependent enzyme [Dialister invisus]|uniref:YggS family pyridoxal phosphate-dependent enzyme n=1 Tax=Dialister invisus TaxID=218538 RepID=UPI00352148F8